MRRAVTSLLALGVVAGVVCAPSAAADPVVEARTATPANAMYTLDLSTPGGGRNWTGSETVKFENTGASALEEVWFRLWANGTTGCSDPGIVVSNVTGAIAAAPSVACTALELSLPQPLSPGETATVTMDLAIRLPAANGRFGWYQRTGRLGNAVPVLAVNDDEGWHLDPFFDSGESFYSLVGDWSVTLEVPADLQTPATGALASATALGHGREARVFVARDVRDFAWEAGRFDHVRTQDEHGVIVRLWYRDGLLSDRGARRLVRRSAGIMDTFSAAFGAYPYPEVDVVITSFDLFSGMEYPQLVMTIPSPLVISHELAHQWWYGIVGDDQYEDPWIDEGFAQWSMYLPFASSPSGWPPLPFVGCRMYEWPNDVVRLSSGVDYFDAHQEDYSIPYLQGACALARLAQDFGGLRPFLEVLHDYAAAHWLGVTTNADFMAAIAAAASARGIDLDPATFFDRWRISRP